MDRKAFTTIELMVAIGIMVLLASIAYVSIRTVSSHTKQQSTLTSLETLQGMLGEMTARDRSSLNGPPFRTFNTLGVPQTVLAPGLVTADDSNDSERYGNAVIQTQRVMRRLLSIPANKIAFDRVPNDRRIPVKWASGVSYEVGDIVWFWSPPNQRVNKETYMCIRANTSSGSTGPAGGGGWVASSANPTAPLVMIPVLGDAWGNPIIYCPSGYTPDGRGGVNAEGLADVRTTSATTLGGIGYRRGSRVIQNGFYFTALQNVRGVGVNNRSFWFRGIVSPDGRPFFASAGENGAFGALAGRDARYGTNDDVGAGDDNIYSFSK